MIPVDEAEARIRHAFVPTPAEWVHVDRAHGRVLADNLSALRDQPAADVSAMDGYAVRAAEALVDAGLAVEGEAAAGAAAGAALAPGSARRIFTGGLVPEGADTILIQEDAERLGGRLRVRAAPEAGRHIRRRGEDFRAGDTLLTAGQRLGARALGLAVALGYGHVSVRRRPRVGVAGTGNELVRPGVAASAAEVPNSNVTAISAVIAAHGAEALDLGIVRDRPEALADLAGRAQGLDLLVTTGGASVGDHDLVRSALGDVGLELDFWKLAMRPGKPLLFGRLGPVPVLGLPGNPVSALVCALLFVRAAIQRLAGEPATSLPLADARLAGELAPNGERQDFMRTRLWWDTRGDLRAAPAAKQDSAMLATLTRADGLLVRPPHAAAAADGSLVKVVRFAELIGF